jgi:small-conductance mechanosensitive channel
MVGLLVAFVLAAILMSFIIAYVIMLCSDDFRNRSFYKEKNITQEKQTSRLVCFWIYRLWVFLVFATLILYFINRLFN